MSKQTADRMLGISRKRAVRHQWILNWLQMNTSADALNSPFHDAYHEAFPDYARKETLWGAQPVAQAQRDL